MNPANRSCSLIVDLHLGWDAEAEAVVAHRAHDHWTPNRTFQLKRGVEVGLDPRIARPTQGVPRMEVDAAGDQWASVTGDDTSQGWESSMVDDPAHFVDHGVASFEEPVRH